LSENDYFYFEKGAKSNKLLLKHLYIMSKVSKFTILFLFVFYHVSTVGYSQTQDDSSKVFRNTVRMNLTNPMFFGEKNLVLGYERVISDNKSFSVNVGVFSLPVFRSIRTDSILLNDGSKDRGFSVAGDYRFYLKKENKFSAPRGVYLGPYYSYSYFQRANTWSLNTFDFFGNLETKIVLHANLIGAQMGYQFVIRDRFTVDMILLGPGFWFYTVKTELSTDLSEADEEMLFEKINEILTEKFPGNDFLLKPGAKITSDAVTTSSLGLRYVISVGFRF